MWRWGGAFSSFSLEMREGSAGEAQRLSLGTSWKAPACPYEQAHLPALHLWRFLTRPPDFFAGPKGQTTHVIQAALALPFIRRVAAT